MTNNDEFALREELRRLEAEIERLERDRVDPSWDRGRIVALETRLARIEKTLVEMRLRMGEISLAQELAMSALTKVEAVEHRLEAYDAMCLSARMHDQVFLTAGEVKGLSEAFDIRVGALDAKVKAIEDRLADDGR